MKVQFLYNDAIHAWPLLEARDAAAAIGMTLLARLEQSSQAFDRHFSADCDCILIHQELMSEHVIESGKPVVILERTDGAQLDKSRRWLADVAGCVKGYCLRPATLNNQFRGRLHCHRLREAGVLATAKSRAVDGLPAPIAATDLGKIRPFFGFGAYEKQARLLSTVPDLTSRRSTAVHFAGVVSYDGSEVETHRRLAAATCGRIRGGVGLGGRQLRPGDYYEGLLDSRSVLSPWGWGEACHRDYEAWILGAVLIKPESDYVEGWPDAYRAGTTYLPCRADFADVPEIVARVHRDWRGLLGMRMHCRQLAEMAADPLAIAGRLKQILETWL